MFFCQYVHFRNLCDIIIIYEEGFFYSNGWKNCALTTIYLKCGKKLLTDFGKTGYSLLFSLINLPSKSPFLPIFFQQFFHL